MPDAVSEKRLRHVESLAHLLDDSIRLPVVGYRIGWEAIIGLVPGIGDVAGLVLSVYLIVQAARFGVPAASLARMVFNVVVEALVGLVPVLGDAFDAAYKANLRNVDLLHAHLGAGGVRQRRADRRGVFGVAAALVLVVLLVLGLLGLLVWGVVQVFGG